MEQQIKQLPMFCIHLQRAVERKYNMQQLWIEKLGFNLKFWNAYDRRDIEQGVYKYKCSQEKAKQNLGREMSNGEIACSTSFISLYEYIIKNNIQEAIIMEDDIYPIINGYDQLHNLISIGKNEFPNAEMMLLHEPCKFDKIPNEEIYNIKNTYFSQCNITPWGNQMFYITIEGVRELLAALNPVDIETVADRAQHGLAKQGKVIIANNAVCLHDWSRGTTYIGNDKRNTGRIFMQ
jgi:GR25 family glycosyltransferase involved in LPS biosynthesis